MTWNSPRTHQSGKRLYVVNFTLKVKLYAQSPISRSFLTAGQGDLLFSNELARRYGNQGIISCAAHPGSLQSDLYRHVSFVERLVMVSGIYHFHSCNLSPMPNPKRPILYPVTYGALTPLWAGTTAAGLEFNGKVCQSASLYSIPLSH